MDQRNHLLPIELENSVVLETFSPSIILLLLAAAIAQPVMYPLFLFLLSSSALLGLLGFMFGCLGLCFWMAFEAGMFKPCASKKGKTADSHCMLRVFWVFVTPIFPIIAVINLIFLHIINLAG